MNYSNTNEPDIVIDLKDVLWNLLSRWKILLVMGIIMALLVGGYMYLRADRSYQAALQAQEKEKTFASLPAEERATKVMEEYQLSDDDQRVVMYLVKQQEIVKSLQDYLYGSLFLNLNPSNQRILSLTYYLKSSDADLQTLVDGYEFYMRRKPVLRQLGDVISPGTDLNLIFELVDGDSGEISDSDVAGIDFTVKIILPEDTDASAVEEIVTKALRKGRAELSKSVGEHTMSLMNKQDVHRYNPDSVDRRTSVTSNINNLQNNIQNFRTKLSAEQLEALNAVTAVYSSTEDEVTSSGAAETGAITATPPGLSPKYLLAGFLLGMLLYAGVFVVFLVLRRRINTAEDLERISGGRLLGTIHWQATRSGWERLNHSKLIDRFRYRGAKEQSDEYHGVVSSLEAVCNHTGVDKLHFLSLVTPEGEGAQLISRLAVMFTDDGFHAEPLDVSGTIEESDLLNVQNAVIIAERGSSIASIWNIMKLCEQYDVNLLGNVYLASR